MINNLDAPAAVTAAAKWLEEQTGTPAHIKWVTGTHILVIHEGNRLRLELNYRRTRGSAGTGRWTRRGSCPLYLDGQRRENAEGWNAYVRLFQSIEHPDEKPKLHLPDVTPMTSSDLPRGVLAVFNLLQSQQDPETLVLAGRTPGSSTGYTFVLIYTDGTRAHVNLELTAGGCAPESDGYVLAADMDGNDVTDQVVRDGAGLQSLLGYLGKRKLPATPQPTGQARSAPGSSNSVAERRHSVIRV